VDEMRMGFIMYTLKYNLGKLTA